MFSFWYYLAWLPLPLGWCPAGPELTSHCKLHICSNFNFFKCPSENLKRRYILIWCPCRQLFKISWTEIFVPCVYVCNHLHLWIYLCIWYENHHHHHQHYHHHHHHLKWKSKFLQTGRGRGSEGQTNWQQRTGKDLAEITIQIQITMSKKIWQSQN